MNEIESSYTIQMISGFHLQLDFCERVELHTQINDEMKRILSLYCIDVEYACMGDSEKVA